MTEPITVTIYTAWGQAIYYLGCVVSFLVDLFK